MPTPRSYPLALANLPDYALIPLADALLLRWLRATNPVEGHERDLQRVYRLRAEWLDLSERVDLLIEELAMRAEEGKGENELEQATRAAEG